MRGLVNHPEGDGLDGWPGKASRVIGDAGCAGLDIDGEGHEGVDQREGVRAGRPAPGEGRDAGDVGRELHDQRARAVRLAW